MNNQQTEIAINFINETIENLRNRANSLVAISANGHDELSRYQSWERAEEIMNSANSLAWSLKNDTLKRTFLKAMKHS